MLVTLKTKDRVATIVMADDGGGGGDDKVRVLGAVGLLGDLVAEGALVRLALSALVFAGVRVP
jgi:hypothetical protein